MHEAHLQPPSDETVFPVRQERTGLDPDHDRFGHGKVLKFGSAVHGRVLSGGLPGDETEEPFAKEKSRPRRRVLVLLSRCNGLGRRKKYPMEWGGEIHRSRASALGVPGGLECAELERARK